MRFSIFITIALWVAGPFVTARFEVPDPINNCTLPNCWNLEKCSKSFSIYLYPWVPQHNETFWAPRAVDPFCTLRCYSLECQRIAFHSCFYYTMATTRGFRITTNPDEACLFVPSISLCLGGNYFSAAKLNRTEKELWSLPYWNGGQNHVLWNVWNDWPSPGIDPQKAVVVSASFMNETYRPQFDVSLPLARFEFRDPEALIVNAGWAVRDRLEADPAALLSDILQPIVAKKDLLLYFKGSVRQFLSGACPWRARIFGKFFIPPTNISDVIIEATCLGNHNLPRGSNLTQVPHCRGCINNQRPLPGGGTESCTAGMPGMDFTVGLTRAKFGLAPRGCGSQSFRMLETIGLGAVPVVTGYGTFLPFAREGYLGRLYDKCIVFVPEEELPGLIPRLREMPQEEYYGRLVACLQIATYNSHSMRVQSQQAICAIGLRIANLVTNGQPDSWWPPRLRQVCAEVGVLPPI